MGSIIGFLSAGFMCKWSFAGGWPSIFYIYGKAFEIMIAYISFSLIMIDMKAYLQVIFSSSALVACVWLLAWALLVYDNPIKHPFIRSKEKEYVTMATEVYVQHGIVSIVFY